MEEKENFSKKNVRKVIIFLLIQVIILILIFTGNILYNHFTYGNIDKKIDELVQQKENYIQDGVKAVTNGEYELFRDFEKKQQEVEDEIEKLEKLSLDQFHSEQSNEFWGRATLFSSIMLILIVAFYYCVSKIEKVKKFLQLKNYTKAEKIIFKILVALLAVNLGFTIFECFVPKYVRNFDIGYNQYTGEYNSALYLKSYPGEYFFLGLYATLSTLSMMLFSTLSKKIGKSKNITYSFYLGLFLGLLGFIITLIMPCNEKNVNQLDIKDGYNEIKKYKKLFDSGIITQEEFDAKKKEILNL